MSWLSSFLHPGRQYQAAQDQMEKYYGQGQGYLDPYSQGGMQAGGQMQGALGKLMDPAALQDEWMKNYETSEQAKQLQNQAGQYGLDAASSMGLMGSTPALEAIQGGKANIGMRDRQNYLQDLMDKYKTGIGLGENIYGVGAGAAGQQSQNAMHMGDIMGGLAAGRQGAGGAMMGGILGNLASKYTGFGAGGGGGAGGGSDWATALAAGL